MLDIVSTRRLIKSDQKIDIVAFISSNWEIFNGVRSTKGPSPSIELVRAMRQHAFKPHGAFQNTMLDAVKDIMEESVEGPRVLADMTLRQISTSKISNFQTFYGTMIKEQ